MKFNLEVPLNSLSLGQMGYGVTYEIFKRGLEPNVFPIGNVDLKSFNKDTNFEYWLSKCIKASLSDFQKYPTIKHFHLNGAERKLGSGKQVLWTVHECDRLTEQEIEICRGYDKIFVTSNYSKDVFVKHGVDAEFCPNFFDANHFKVLNRQYEGEKPITFSLIGKMEKRKHSRNICVAFANKFGNKKGYLLNACIFNHFLPPEAQAQEISSWFGGRIPINCVFHPFIEKNSDLNTLMDYTDVSLEGLSGSEGWGLCSFNNMALGKQAIVLDAHGHQSFANSENSILVQPSGIQDIADGIFFHPAPSPFNVGNFYTVDQESIHAAMDEAVSRVKSGVKNSEGLKLQSEFSVGRTVDMLLSSV